MSRSRTDSSNYNKHPVLASTLLYNPVKSVNHIADRNQTNKRDKEKPNMLNKLNKRRGGFTLVEIMIVVAIIALLAAIAVPGFLRARKRSQASRVLNDLRLIDAAVDQYAIENNKTSGDVVPTNAWTAYLKSGTSLYSTGQDLFSHPVRLADRGSNSARSHRDVRRVVGCCSEFILVAVLLIGGSNDSFSCHRATGGRE